MTIPTNEEIEAALAGITADGPMAKATLDLGMLVLKHPALRQFTDRVLSHPATTELELQALVTGAIMYGLNLGLRIGDVRMRER